MTPQPLLLATDLSSALRSAAEAQSAVLEVVLRRAREGSRPGARNDDHLVALAIEGGGMRGAISSGMCVVLEAAGLTKAFDRVYGVSSGALNGSALCAGQAASSATNYQDAAARRFINKARWLLGRPVVDLDLLFDDVIRARKPLSAAGLAAGPEFRAIATSVETRSLRVLRDFAGPDDVLDAVRASAALPVLTGSPPLFRGERMVDGGLVESIPFRTALCEGATHVLVLRSRSAGFRTPARSRMSERIGSHDDPGLLELIRARPALYNAEADELQRIAEADGAAARVLQICVPEGARMIGRLETRPERVVGALRLGAAALAARVLCEPIDILWQPVAYLAAQPRPAPAPLPHATRALLERARHEKSRIAAALAGASPSGGSGD